VAAIFEFSGAVLLGGGVASTIMNRITDRELFSDNPELLMIGMCCTEFSTAIWLTTASLLGLPVSTTHSVIGGIIGFSLVANYGQGIQWFQLLRIVISWFASPVLSGLIASCAFAMLRHLVLRRENSMELALRTYPVVVGLTIAINGYYIFYYGPATDPSWLPPQWQGMLWAAAAAVVLAASIQLTFIRCAQAVASFVAAVLTELYLCNVCSCPEILRRHGRAQVLAGAPHAQLVCQEGRCARPPAYCVHTPTHTANTAALAGASRFLGGSKWFAPLKCPDMLGLQEDLLQPRRSSKGNLADSSAAHTTEYEGQASSGV
jgi:hypothetical protein